MTLAGLHLVAVLSAVMQDSALVARAHGQPDSVRESIRTHLASSEVTSAHALARAYAVAWRDSFFVREVERFTAWPEAARSAKLAADSLRRAGNAALGRYGVAAAMRDWRESLQRCEAIADSAGMGAALGNIGAGFYQSGELDSAASYFERARLVAARVGDVRTQGNATGALASVTADRGDLRQAAGLYARAAELRAQSGDDRGAAADRNNLGLIAQNLGDLDGARSAFTTALASNRRAARDDAAAVNLINLGNLASLVGDYPQATAHYHEALALDRSGCRTRGARTQRRSDRCRFPSTSAPASTRQPPRASLLQVEAARCTSAIAVPFRRTSLDGGPPCAATGGCSRRPCCDEPPLSSPNWWPQIG